jgi:protocatechuate 3,4-dioxygenase beta subunit
MRPVLLLLLVAFAAVAQGGRLAGTVVDASGEPVQGAYVQALAGEPPEVVAQAQTDGNGRYTFEVPEGLFTLAVTARGYYVLSAGGLESETITQSCPAEGACREVDFRLGKRGVLEGWLTDRFGDAAAGALLVLRPAEGPTFYRRGLPGTYRGGATLSDDRGYFRIWNLRPGRYVLESDSRMRPNAEFRQTFQLPPQEVEIGEQAEAVELRLSVDSLAGLHSISGIVEGAETLSGAVIGIQAKSRDRRMSYPMYYRLNGGRFSIPGLRTDEYVLRLVVPKVGPERPETQMLGELRVDRDMTGLRLTPQPGGGIHLKVLFREMAKRNLDLRLWPAGDSGVSAYIAVLGPDYEVTQTGLVPGEYELRALTDDYYLAEPYHVTVQAGQVTPLTIEVGNAFASLHGRVRVPAGAQRAGASHFTVGARGPHGRYVKQADEDGRFGFEKLPPGPYTLAAWPKPEINVDDDRVWSEAAGVVDVELEPGFDVEIDVTATR